VPGGLVAPKPRTGSLSSVLPHTTPNCPDGAGGKNHHLNHLPPILPPSCLQTLPYPRGVSLWSTRSLYLPPSFGFHLKAPPPRKPCPLLSRPFRPLPKDFNLPSYSCRVSKGTPSPLFFFFPLLGSFCPPRLSFIGRLNPRKTDQPADISTV